MTRWGAFRIFALSVVLGVAFCQILSAAPLSDVGGKENAFREKSVVSGMKDGVLGAGLDYALTRRPTIPPKFTTSKSPPSALYRK